MKAHDPYFLAGLVSVDGDAHYYSDLFNSKQGYAEAIPLTSLGLTDSDAHSANGLKRGLFQYDSRLDFTVTSGWDFPLLSLLFHALIAFHWGVALFIFALGIVPVDWNLSQLGKDRPGITNTLVSLVAALSTMHVRYVVQQTLEQYSRCLIVHGFTLGHLRWMQGVRELSLFTSFPRRAGMFPWFPWMKIVWIVAYIGIVLHTASLVAILQPNIFFKHKLYNDPVPCGRNESEITLNVDPFLKADEQQNVDMFSFNVGKLLTNYGEQVNGNTTSSISGRVYSKDSYAYGAIGGLIEGLQETPGTLYKAQCSDDPKDAISIWQNVFPNLFPPDIITNGSSFVFTDDAIPPQVKSIVSNDNVTESQSAMYALVQPSGSGALLSIADYSPTIVCSWNALPKLVHVQIVRFAARTLGSVDTELHPPLVGRATLMTLRGMAEAYREGTSLQKSVNPFGAIFRYEPATYNIYNRVQPPANASQILEILLADGGKAALTLYNTHFSSLGVPSFASSGMKICYSNNRTVQEHWKFGNANNLGWFATIWTSAIGAFAVVATLRMSGKKRMQNIGMLEVAQAFSLGRGGVIRDEEIFCVRNGRIVLA